MRSTNFFCLFAPAWTCDGNGGGADTTSLSTGVVVVAGVVEVVEVVVVDCELVAFVDVVVVVVASLASSMRQ